MIGAIARAWKLALAWTLSLVTVGALASVLTSAQAGVPQSLGLPIPEITEGTTILSGSDIGFRVERMQGGIPIGTLVVRVDGRWVEAGTSVRLSLTR
jgi:hypothetical protein